MPWTERQVRYLLSDHSPLNKKQKAEMKRELHKDPSLGHLVKGGPELKRKK